MTRPERGRVMGTTRVKRVSGSLSARSRMACSSFAAPTVSVAMTRTLGISATSLPAGGCCVCRCDGAGRLLDVGPAEHAVHGARHAVLVRPADDGRHGIEVEDR